MRGLSRMEVVREVLHLQVVESWALHIVVVQIILLGRHLWFPNVTQNLAVFLVARANHRWKKRLGRG